MLRTHLKQLALAVAFAIAACASAKANFYLDVQYASGGDAGSTPYSVNIASANDVVTLNVYAFISDASPSSTNDQYKSAIASFLLAGSTDIGDVAWGSFSGNVAGVATKGSQFTTTYGGLGLGGSSTSDNLATHLWSASANGGGAYINGTNANPAGFVATISGSTGYEYLLGTLSVSFSRNATLTNATEPFSVLATNKTGSVKSFNWLDSVTTSNLGTFGSASNVGNGNYNLAPAVLNFNFSGGSGPTTNPAALSAALSFTGSGTTLLGGGTASLTGSVTNSGVSPANPLNWGSTGPGVISLSPTAGSGLAGGASTPISGTLTAFANGFGPWVSTATFTGTDATTGTPLPSVPKSLSFTIIGKGTTGTTDGNGIPNSTYGNLMTTQTTVSSLAGLTTTLGSGPTSSGIGATTATILAGSLASAATVSETWRSRASQELPANVAAHVAGSSLPLYGDVVNLSGIAGGAANAYVLQMTYDPTTLNAASAASGGFLYLGYRSPSGAWQNAVLANDTTGANATQNVQSSFAAFTTANPSFTLASMLGTWGVDTANNDVWAVIDHDAEFAPVPEPGTIALLVGGIAALGFAYRRRKAAKA